jgi:MtrB/PioB family decaheme-associated outer membrane protein
MNRKGVLRGRRTILLAGSMLMAAGSFSGALAADQEPLIAKAATPEIADWYYFGGLEAGGRFVIQRPPSGFGYTSASSGGACTLGGVPPQTKCFLTPSQTESRAKFEEYGAVHSAPFLDWINLQTGTRDGRYALDFWGRSVGVNNQAYELNVSKIGEHYMSLAWEEIPHLISTSAKNIFGGVGSTFLTVDPTLRALLNAQLPNAAANNPAGDAARTNIQNLINNAATPLELATRRDRASAGYRWTPTPETEATIEYSNEHRTGTRPVGIAYGWGTAPSPRPTNPVEVPQPLDDRTQNIAARVERAHMEFLGLRITSNVNYNGSVYDNSLKQLDVQNPFCFTCNVLTGGPGGFGPQMLRLGLYPDNNANAITWNTAVDFPFLKARNVTTFQFNQMRQNDAFVNTGTNGLAAPPVTTQNGTIVGSLNGEVNTLLWNDVLTFQPDKDVKVTVRGRHYSIDNLTPSLHIENWIFGDSGCASGAPNPITGQCPAGNARNSLPIAYTKDNASGETTWRATKWATVGGGVYWERYDRKFRDVDVTNEGTAKVWIDVAPEEQVRARVSYQFGERRYKTYDQELFVTDVGLQSSEPASNMRRYDIANRNRQKGDALLELSPGGSFTFTPNLGFRLDDYPDPVFNPLGVRHDHSWNAGGEIAALVAPTFKLLGAYNYEERRLNMAGGTGGANVNTGNPLADCSTSAVVNPAAFAGTSCTWLSDITQRYHSFMLAADFKVVPSRFDLRLEYLLVLASEENNTIACPAPAPAGNACNGLQTTTPPTNPASLNFGQFPPEENRFQRFNVIGRYYVDPSVVRQMGWTGDVTVKLRYTWERNRNSNWASDNMTPYVGSPDSVELTGGGRSFFLAAFNPNYTAQVVAASVALKW